MGCPDIYYIRALQSLAHCFAYNNGNVKLARKLSNETSKKRLEDFILLQKEHMEEKQFYYHAGRASQYVLEEAEREGVDSMNASCGGIFEFECFLGIRSKIKD